MSMRVRLQRFATLLAAGSLAVVLPSPAAAAAKPVSESAEVVVVEVPVQVVRDGEPVRGLTAAEFELYDGRKKVNIEGFDVLDLAAAPTAAEPAVPAAARRHFLLLFDLTFSDPFALVRGRKAAKGILGDLHPTDLVGVATYSQTGGVQMLVGFTPDRAQAAAAIDTLGLPKFFTPSSDPLRLVFTAPGKTTEIKRERTGQAGETLDELDSQVADSLKTFSILTSGTQRSTEQLIVRNMTASFADLARLMAEVDGRKYVVLMSEGFNSSLLTGSAGATYAPGEHDLAQMIGASASPDQISGTEMSSGADESLGDSRTLNQLEKMLGEMRRADCQIQAVDIGGMRALAAEGRTEANGRESLLTMAKDTGGDVYENFNNLSAAMGQMLRRTGVTYVLSFSPGSLPKNGEFHKLRVEVKGAARGARVVHRPGYYAPLPYGQQPPLLRALQTADAMMGEEGGAIGSAVLAAPYASSGERAYVPLVVEVDGPTLLGGKPGPQVPVEIYVYAMDEAGAVHDYRTQSLALDFAKAEAQLRQSGLKFFGHVALPRGKYSVRTLVRNAATGASSLRVSDIVVPAFAGGEATLLPPLFPEPAGKWLVVRQALQQGEAQPPYPFMLGGAPFIPSSRPVLVPGQAADVVLEGYNLAAGDVTAKAEVLGADGSVQPGGALEVVKQSGSTMRVVSAKFQPPQLQPGEYRLRVTVTDAAGKSASSTGAFAVGGVQRAAAGR